MDESLLDQLFRRYIDKSATDAEKQAFFRMIADPSMAHRLKELSEHYPVPFEALYRMNEGAAKQILETILSISDEQAIVPNNAGEILSAGADVPAETARRRPPVFRMSWFKYAAAAIVLVVSVTYLWFSQVKSGEKEDGSAAVIVAAAPAIGPGVEGAILTLADGTQVVLDSLENGRIVLQNGVWVSLSDGLLTYDSIGGPVGGVAYNTMTTPNGRQFKIVLPDGSHVWLNAASSIKYPTAFTGQERMVEATGEMYFEVSTDASKPFRVKTKDGLIIEVIGTHFNLNAYRDDPGSKTTLLEGRIRVIKNGIGQIMLPGEQAIVDDDISIRKGVDLDEVMAWKDGFFNFRNRSLDEVMRMLARWYDIGISYPQGIPSVELGGKMGRDLNLDQVLEGLSDLNVNYKLEGRTLVILP